MIHRCPVEPEDLGPLLLGQLAPGRAREVARRVAACPLCAAEAADLAPVVAALRAYPSPEAVALSATTPAAPPRAAGLETVLAGVQAERTRRHRRGLLAAAAAVAALALGAATAQLATGGPDPSPPAPAAVDVRLAGTQGGQGEARLAPRRWGTAIHLQASGLDPAARYGVWLAAEDGGRLPAGSFRPTVGGAVDLRLAVGLPLDAGRVLGVSRLPAEAGSESVDVLEARVAG